MRQFNPWLKALNLHFKNRPPMENSDDQRQSPPSSCQWRKWQPTERGRHFPANSSHQRCKKMQKNADLYPPFLTMCRQNQRWQTWQTSLCYFFFRLCKCLRSAWKQIWRLPEFQIIKLNSPLNKMFLIYVLQHICEQIKWSNNQSLHLLVFNLPRFKTSFVSKIRKHTLPNLALLPPAQFPNSYLRKNRP